MHLLLFGGTFDPIHHGHLLTARAAAESLAADAVVLIPTGLSPHKVALCSSTGPDRLAMCRLAVQNERGFLVNDVEVKRPGPSYTFDTLTALSQHHAGADFTLLMGADQLPLLHTWHRAAELLHRARVAVLGRHGAPMDLAPLAAGVPGVDLRRITLLQTPVIQISATDIRARVAAGKPIRWMVPAGVETYIREKALYGSG